MKLLQYTTLLLFWANFSLAQPMFHNIIIVQNNNDKIISQTYDKNKIEYCYGISYEKSLNEKVRFSPNEIKSYVIKDNLKNKEITYKSLKYVGREGNETQIFGKVLFEGDVNLYKVYVRKDEIIKKVPESKYYYLVEKDDAIERLYYSQNAYPNTSQPQPYFKVLKNFFNTDDLDKKIGKTQYKDKHLINLFNNYHLYLSNKESRNINEIKKVDNNDNKEIVNAAQKEHINVEVSSPIKFVLFAGVTSLMSDNNGQFGFNGGMMLDFIDPSFSENISFTSGFDYNATKKKDGNSSKWIEIPLMMNLTTELSGDGYFFCGAGPVFTRLSTKALRFTNSGITTEVPVSNSFFSPAISIGGVINNIKIFTFLNLIGVKMEGSSALIDLNIGMVF